jgi:hypothetical protein
MYWVMVKQHFEVLDLPQNSGGRPNPKNLAGRAHRAA